MTDQTIRIILQGDGAQLGSAAAQGVQALGKLGTAGEQAGQRVARGSQAAVLSMRQISPQLTDIATSLASGQSPFLVLLQQGGQLKDMAGGLRPLLGSLAAVLTPTTLLMGGAAAAVGLLGTAAFQGAQQDAKLRDSLALTGNAAGLTADGFRVLAQQVSAATGGTVGASREIVQALVDTGKIGGGAMGSLGTAIARVADVTGKSASEVAADFADMTRGVGDWAVKHNEAWHFATAAQIAYIRQLEDTGQQQRAMIEVGDLLTRHLAGQQQQVGTLEKAWRGLAQAVSQGWESALSVGRDQTPAERLQDAIKRRSFASTPGGRVINSEDYDKAQRDIVNANSDLLRQQERASMAALTASEEAAKIAAAEKARRDAARKTSAGGSGPDPEAAYRRSVADILRNRAPRLADIEAAGYGAATAAGNANEAATLADARRLQEQQARMAERAQLNAADYAAQFQQQAALLNASLITDDQARMQAQLEIERQGYQARIDELAAHGADVRGANDSLAAWVVARQAQMVDQLKPQWQRMLEDWSDTTRLMQGAWDVAITDMLNGAAQQFGRWATGQGGSLGNVFRSFASQIAEAQFKSMIGSLGTSAASSGGWAAAIASLFGFADGGVFPPGTGVSAYRNQVVNRPTMFAFANGAGLMGEAGPEAIMPLRRGPGGRLGVEAAGGGRPVVNISQPITLQIDARSDQAQVAQIATAAVKQGNAALLKTLKAQGVL